MKYRLNSNRLKNFNYKSTGYYFFTLCINQHLCLFGEIHKKKMVLNNVGRMILSVFENLSEFYAGIDTDTYIVMPDHFHGIIRIERPVGASLRGRPGVKRKIVRVGKFQYMTKYNFYFYGYEMKRMNGKYMGRARRPAPTGDRLSLGEIVGRFKSYTTRQYISGVKNDNWIPFYEKLWQRGYYDRIIRNKSELYAIRQYIINNPKNWLSG